MSRVQILLPDHGDYDMSRSRSRDAVQTFSCSGHAGNVRTRTLKAFPEAAMEIINCGLVQRWPEEPGLFKIWVCDKIFRRSNRYAAGEMVRGRYVPCQPRGIGCASLVLVLDRNLRDRPGCQDRLRVKIFAMQGVSQIGKRKKTQLAQCHGLSGESGI